LAVLGAAALAIAALFLALRLFDPALSSRVFFVWESGVLWAFEQEMKGATSLARSLQERLTWQPGLLSSGGDSLLYGFPTLVLLTTARASALLFRLPAALLALASLVLAWDVSRRLHGAAAGAMTAWMWLLAPAFVAYSFYGTSVTAVWVSVWLALGAVHHLLSRPSADAAFLALAALYLATLQYAPGRLVATGLLLASLGALALPGAPRGRVRSIAILLAGAAALLFINTRRNPVSMFYGVRGENFVSIRTSAEYAADYLGHRVSPTGPLTPADTIELAVALLRRNAPDYAWLVAPVNPLAPLNARKTSDDPPRVPLVLAPALPLALWGLVLSLRPWGGSPRTGWVFATAFLLATVPLLLTNRVDVGRAAVLLPFLALWGGLGAADLGTRLTRSVPRAAVAGVGFVFCAGLLLQIHALGLDAPLQRSPATEALLAEVRAKPGPVRIGTRVAGTQTAWLEALVRLRSHPELRPAQIPSQEVERLLNGSTHSHDAVDLAFSLSRDAALLLAPARDFSALYRDAEARGLHFEIGGTTDFPILRLEARTPQ
jgi:hypothetical protein